MAEINATIAPRNGNPSEDGPFQTADGKYYFCTITIDGTYDPAVAARAKLVHDSPADLQKMAGIKYVKAIDWLSCAASAAGGFNTGSGKYKGRLDVNNQRVIVLRVGTDGAGNTVDEAEPTSGAPFTSPNHLVFDARVLGD